MKTYEKVYTLVKKISKGKVATYGQIGQILGLDPRMVGWALNKLANHYNKVPWHRVINSKGTISTNRVMNIPLGLQKKLLQREGVRFNRQEKVDLKKYLSHITK